MTIASLRKTLNELPSEYDDREVYFCDRFEEDGDRVVSFEEPIIGSVIPDSNNLFLFVGKKAMDYLTDRNPEVDGDNDGSEWVRSKI